MAKRKEKELYQMNFDEVLQNHGVAIFRLSVGNAKKLMQMGKQNSKWTSSARVSGLGSKTYDVTVNFKDVTFFENKLGKKHHKSETKNQNEGSSSYSVKSLHKKSIQEAIQEGKTVPSVVFKEYPELKPDLFTYSTFKKTLDTAVKNVNQSTKKVMAKATKKPRKKATAKPKTAAKKRTVQPKVPKQTKAQIKAKMSAAGKKNYKGSKLQQINKLATEMQEMSGTKQITVPKLSRKEATKRAANKLRLGL